MTPVALEDASAQLSQSISDAQAGAEIIITRNNAPVTKIVPLEDTPPLEDFKDCM